MSAVRELLGAGALFGFAILPESVEPMSIMILPPGGFFVFGVFMALALFIERKTTGKEPDTCGACPSAGYCPAKGVGE
jgi:electron transport complex protein RnfE